MEGKLISAMALDPEQIREFEAYFSSKFNDDIALAMDVDPDLIGGVVVIIGNQVFDASVRNMLSQMHEQLSH